MFSLVLFSSQILQPLWKAWREVPKLSELYSQKAENKSPALEAYDASGIAEYEKCMKCGYVIKFCQFSKILFDISKVNLDVEEIFPLPRKVLS